jgi:hypothetical protein
MPIKTKKQSVAKKPISWPLESRRDSNVDEKYGIQPRKLSATWPAEIEDGVFCGDDGLEGGTKFSSCSQPSPPKRSTSLSSVKRDMSLGSILNEGRQTGFAIEPSGSYHTPEPVEIDSPSSLPSETAWRLAGEVELIDSDGNKRPFKSIYSGSTAVGEQQLVIFVRHFFCGVS